MPTPELTVMSSIELLTQMGGLRHGFLRVVVWTRVRTGVSSRLAGRIRLAEVNIRYSIHGGRSRTRPRTT
jgi:hypothetical protein